MKYKFHRTSNICTILLMLNLFNITITEEIELSDSLISNENEYIGEWPLNLNKDIIKGPDMQYICNFAIDKTLNDIGCDCEEDSQCINNNCVNMPRGKSCLPKNGDIFPDFSGIDQFEDLVSIYDFAYQDKYILIEMATAWCEPCRIMADWIAYGSDEITSRRWWKDEYNKIRSMIKSNEIFYITILYEDEFKDYVGYDAVYEWFDNYPEDNVPILADGNKFLHSWIKPTGIPTIILLNEKMEIVQYSNRGINLAFNKLLNINSHE